MQGPFPVNHPSTYSYTGSPPSHHTGRIGVIVGLQGEIKIAYSKITTPYSQSWIPWVTMYLRISRRKFGKANILI